MTIRKVMALCLTGMMTMGLMTACGSSNSNQASSTGSAQSEANESLSADTEVKQNSASTAESAEGTEEGKTLVVYYSATGTTRGVAETLAKVTGGDLFEIEPVEPYTEDDLNWSNNESRVSREHDDESLRDVELVSTSVENWDSYDTVYIGYPIWWGIAAWPVNNFVKANDFTGKTVIPFCTAASSEIGDSGNLLEELTGTGNWLAGDRIQGDASEDDISAWISGLGL